MAQVLGADSSICYASETTFKVTPEILIENCEDVWVAGSANTTVTVDSSDYKVGAGSVKMAVADAQTVGILAYEDFTSVDLSTTKKIGLWIKSSVACSSGDLQLLLDDTSACVSPLETINIPALTAGTWTWVELTPTTPSALTAVISVAIKMAVDKGTFNVWVDDIRALQYRAKTLPFVSESFRLSRNLIDSNTITSSRNPRKPSRGNKEINGDVSVELSPYSHILMYHTLGGTPATTDLTGGKYQHVIKVGTLPTGLTIEKAFKYSDGTYSYFKYDGCKVNSLNVTVATEGPVTASFSLMGAKETVGTASFYPTPQTFTNDSAFDGFEAALLKGGSALGTVTGCNFTIENSLDGGVFVLGGGGERAELPSGRVKVSGNLTVLFDSVTLYNDAIAHTETSLKLTLTRGTGDGTAGNEYLEFLMPDMVFQPNAPVINGPQGVFVELPFTAFYNDAAEATSMQVTYKNSYADFN